MRTVLTAGIRADESFAERILLWEQRLTEPIRTVVVPIEDIAGEDIDALDHVGDPLAEKFLASVAAAGLKGTDDLEALHTLRAQGDTAAQDLWTAVTHVPFFFDFDRMRPVGGFVHRHSFAGLFFAAGALPFTYADPNVAQVFELARATAGLGDQVKRFGETLRAVESVNDPDELRPGGRSWEHWVRVRLIHARVRTGISRTGNWDNTCGIPVSARRIAGGSYVFAKFVRQIYSSLGASASTDEVEAITRAWQWITYLLGGPLDLIPADFTKQQQIDRMLIDRSIQLRESGPAGARLTHEWFESCARRGVLGVPTPVWFVHALARRAIVAGLSEHPEFAAAIVEGSHIRRRVLPDSVVHLVGFLIFILAQFARVGPIGTMFERLGAAITANLIEQLQSGRRFALRVRGRR